LQTPPCSLLTGHACTHVLRLARRPTPQPAASPLQSSQEALPLQSPFPEHDFTSAPLELTLEQIKQAFDSNPLVNLITAKFTELSTGQSLQDHVLQRPEDDPMWPQKEVRQCWPRDFLDLRLDPPADPSTSMNAGGDALCYGTHNACIWVHGFGGR
jgi:hypothetical protein